MGVESSHLTGLRKGFVQVHVDGRPPQRGHVTRTGYCLTVAQAIGEYRRISQKRVAHGRVAHRRVAHGRVSHRKSIPQESNP